MLLTKEPSEITSFFYTNSFQFGLCSRSPHPGAFDYYFAQLAELLRFCLFSCLLSCMTMRVSVWWAGLVVCNIHWEGHFKFLLLLNILKAWIKLTRQEYRIFTESWYMQMEEGISRDSMHIIEVKGNENQVLMEDLFI